MSSLSEKQILMRARAKSLDTVKNLNLWGSNLSDISAVTKLLNVEVLSLSVNNIASLKDFAHCPRLKELYLRKNSVNDLNEIGFLKKLPKLRVLWLSDNPCADSPNYRNTVLKNLPKLIRLDNIAVDENETSMASTAGEEIATPDNLPDFPDLGDTMLSTMGSTVSQNSKENSVPKDSDQCVPSVDLGQKDITRVSLVDETNRLRAELGIKPLNLEEGNSHPSSVNVLSNSRPDSASPEPVDSGNSNILSAVLCLLKELDKSSLETVRNEVESHLSQFSKEGTSAVTAKDLVKEILQE